MRREVFNTTTGILLYPHLIKPFKEENGEEFYRTCILFEKTETIVKIFQTIIERFKDELDEIPSTSKILKDGDKKEQEYFKNRFYINCKTKFKPQIIDRTKKVIEDESEIYSGTEVIANLTMFNYNNKGNEGLSLSINHVLKTNDGEKIIQQKTAFDVFAEYLD